MKNGSHLSRMISISSFSGMMLPLLAASGCGNGKGPFLGTNVPTAPGAGTGLGGNGKGPAPVNMGTAANFVLLAQAAISNIPSSAITGNVGLSPAAGTFITGLSVSGSTCTEVTGTVYVVSGGSPACAVADSSRLTTAIADKNTAFTDAASRAPDYTELGAGNISGLTLSAGTYKWSSPVAINADVTLSGGPNDVWIFEIAQTLTLAPGVHVNLVGGALPQNIYWQVSSSVILDTTTVFKGTLISQTQIAAKTGATVNGKLLAGTQITLDHVTVSP